MKNIYDLVGIGFGPSNLSLGIAVEEFNRTSSKPLSMLFFEKSNDFSWHKDMLIDGATMQVSFLKDLVTLRDPTSEYSFLNYLKDSNRLIEFSNLRTFYPTRIEFNQYFGWAAKKLGYAVEYGKVVVDIRPVGDDYVSLWDVVFEDRRTNIRNSVRCKNISIATGGEPRFPEGVVVPVEARDIFHSSEFMARVQDYDRKTEKSFCVSGGGQSAAEIVEYLHREFPNAKITSIYSNFGYKPSDDSEFINEIFDPDSVDLFFSSSDSLRKSLLKDHCDTNYNVTDLDLIKRLYSIYYSELVTGDRRLFFKRLSLIKEIVEIGGKVRVQLYDKHKQKNETEMFDVLIFASGYKRDGLMNFFRSIKDDVIFSRGQPVVDRYYRLKTNDRIKAPIILQGFSESCHGIGNSLLSSVSTRSQEILENVLLRRDDVVCEHGVDSNVLSG